MPIYEHRCRQCGERFEERRAVMDEESGKGKCPKCGSINTGKVFSLFARASSQPAAPRPRRRC